MVLIEGFHPECFINIGIKCFSCGAVTFTEKRPEGEIYPYPILRIGEGNGSIISSSVEYDPVVILVSDDLLGKKLEALAPNTSKGQAFDVSQEGLDELMRRFENLTGIRCYDRLQELERFKKSGRAGDRELPFVWSISKLQEAFKRGEVAIDDPETNVALTRLYAFARVTEMWGEHPRFAQVMKELRNETTLMHCLAQFILAAQLHSDQRLVGFNIDGEHGQPLPDLYTMRNPSVREYLEVKSPEGLQYVVGKNLNSISTHSKIKSIIKKSKSQINDGHPGSVVIFIDHPDQRILRWSESSASEFFGARHSRRPFLRSVIFMHMKSLDIDLENGKLNFSVECSEVSNPNSGMKRLFPAAK